VIADYNIYSLSNKQRLCFCTVFGIIIAGSLYLFYNSLILSLLMLCSCCPALKTYSKYLAEKRRRELSVQFRDLLYALSSSISAGRQMQEALEEAEETMKLLYGEDALISGELENMVLYMEESRETVESVLEDFALRCGVPDIVRFADIYSISKRTGGDMEKVIRKTVGILFDRIELEQEIHTRTAQKRMEFIILAAMSPAMLLLLRVSSGSYLAIMYETLAGRLLMTIAFLLTALAIFIGFHIMRIRL